MPPGSGRRRRPKVRVPIGKQYNSTRGVMHPSALVKCAAAAARRGCGVRHARGAERARCSRAAHAAATLRTPHSCISTLSCHGVFRHVLVSALPRDSRRPLTAPRSRLVQTNKPCRVTSGECRLKNSFHVRVISRVTYISTPSVFVFTFFLANHIW